MLQFNLCVIRKKWRRFYEIFCYHDSGEYGSGGRLIGQALAERLGIDFYDKEIIYAPMEERLERVRTVYGENEDNNPNFVKKRDKQRSDYYNHYTMNRFGDYHNFGTKS